MQCIVEMNKLESMYPSNVRQGGGESRLGCCSDIVAQHGSRGASGDKQHVEVVMLSVVVVT